MAPSFCLGGVVRGAVPVPSELGSNAPRLRPHRPRRPLPPGPMGRPASGYSTTNDQEAGVDEPDMVKTNGQVMVVLRQDPLGVQVVDVSGSAPKLDGFLPLSQLEQASGLFLAGQDVYVIGGGTSGPLPVRYVGGPDYGQSHAGQSGVGPSTVFHSAPIISLPVQPWGGNNVLRQRMSLSLAWLTRSNLGVARTFTFQGEEQGARLINGQVVLGSDQRAPAALGLPVQRHAVADKSGHGRQPGRGQILESSRLAAVRNGQDRSRAGGHNA